MSDYYILEGVLEGRTPVPCDDIMRWARWMEEHDKDRKVGDTRVGPYWVSTVFLGLDHNWGEGPPLLFETMVFDTRLPQPRPLSELREETERRKAGENVEIKYEGPTCWTEQYQKRYSTWDQAALGHLEAVAWAEQKLAEE